MNNCKHYEYDDYFDRCSDCNATRQEIMLACDTAEQARDYAIDWQAWISEQELSYAELAEWQQVFAELGGRFNLLEEFKENGII